MPRDYIPAKETVFQDWLSKPVGLIIMYRVKAQRGEIQSPPSNMAVVNEG